MNKEEFLSLNYVDVIKKRQGHIKQLRKDPLALKAHIIYYSNNPADFITDWMWTYDPRLKQKQMPFILFDRQREYIQWLLDHWQGKRDGLVEKSRDMGLTYLCMGFAIWAWIFKGGVKIGFGSRKQELVDRLGDMDSILEKGRFILRTLPKEFIPNGYVERKHANFMKFVNPESGAGITGEIGDNIGRGGRNSLYFKDESAFYEHPEKIESALSQNSDVKIDVSTPNGNGNPFYQKRVGGVYDVFTFNWRDDPRKNQEWYDEQKRKYSAVIVAQEIDIDYSASVEGICIPAKYVQAAVAFDIPAEGMIMAGLDVADEGPDKNCLCTGKGCVIQKLEDWMVGDTTETARKAFFKSKVNNVETLRYDNIGVGAGVKGEMNHTDTGNMKVIGVNVGESPTEGQVETDKDNKDMFYNLKAELWWSLRRRFEKVYENINSGANHPIDELISIPNDSELIAELSQPKYHHAENGKILMESKKAMKTRGIKSPNKADALCLYFANIHETAIIPENFGLNTIDYLLDDDRGY